MATYEITGPNGKKYRVSGQGSPEEAMKALQQQLGGVVEQPQPEAPQQPQQSAAPDPDYWSSGATAMDTFTGGLQSKLNAAGGGLIDATIGAIQGDGWNYSDNYNKHLQNQRGQQAVYEANHPVKAAIGQGAGMGLAVMALPGFGQGMKGAIGTGAGYGAFMGAGSDADSLAERAGNTLKGAVTGGTIGAGGYGAGKLAAKGATHINRAWQGMNADAKTRAATRVSQMIDDKYGPNASQMLQKELADIGPDSMLIDVLGEEGLSVGRSAANISPQARETLETTLLGRKAGQNERIVSDIEKAAGLKPGNRKTVETMKAEAYDKVRPLINRAYEKARANGQDIPLDYFSDVLNSPLGEDAFKSAVTSLRNRMAVSGEKAGGNLAVIDEMKKILDSRAEMARRSGDLATADVAGRMAKHLRSQMDVLLNGEYELARQMRRAAYKKDEAFDAGAGLAGRASFESLDAAKKVAPTNQRAMAQAYASQQAENLLNRGATEGAMGSMSTPAGKEAYRLALGQNSGRVDKALEREKNFNRVARALTGNSTTARQLAEMGASGVGAAATTMAMGYDATTGGVAGLMAAVLRKGGPALARKIATSSQREAAPIIAELLTGKGNIPAAQRVITPGTLEKLSKADKDKLVKALLPYVGQSQNTTPQTSLAK